MIYYGRPMEQGRPLYFCPVVCSFSFFLSSPNLNRHRLDVYRTSTHGAALVRIYGAGLRRAARGSLQIQDAKIAKKSPSAHHLTTLSGYIFATKARSHVSTIGKNLLSSNISSRCPPQYGELRPLAAEIGPVVWGS